MERLGIAASMLSLVAVVFAVPAGGTAPAPAGGRLARYDYTGYFGPVQ